jgi:membrane-associated PAP2 superfamily phosphatase
VAFFTISAVLSMGLVGLLKNVTNVDCPWDLIPFGGRFPYVELFADRPDALRAAHCSCGACQLRLRAARPYTSSFASGTRGWRNGLTVGLLTGLTFSWCSKRAARLRLA